MSAVGLRRLGARAVALLAAPPRDVRRASLRVAIVATAVVLVAYVLIAGAVMMIVNHNLVAAVDDRLTTYMSDNVTGTGQPPSPGSFRNVGPVYQEPILVWVVLPNGQVGQVVGHGLLAATGSGGTTRLPQSATSATSATTATLDGGDQIRVVGVANITLPAG